MNGMRVILLITIALVMASGLAQAQKNYAQEADEAFRLYQFYDAIEMYKSAYNKVGRNRVEKVRILFQIGECYRKINDVKRAEQTYKRVIASNYPDPIVHLHFGDVLKQQGKYIDAIEQYKIYSEKVPEDERGNMGVKSCELAQRWIDNPTRYEVENIKRINSNADDFGPAYADRKFGSLVFASTRPDATGKKADPNTGQSFSDIFLTTKDRKGNWSQPVVFDPLICGIDNEGAATFSVKYNTLYFTRCPVVKKQIVGCQIWISTKRGRGWAEPEHLSVSADSSSVGHPTITSNERDLYFASDIPGGYGGRDIWYATRTRKNRPFGAPVNLGPVINTPGNEMFPYIREYSDGRTALYFASDGHPGMGGLDIYRSEWEGAGWGAPDNMMSPINSMGDDFAIIFEGDLEKGFLTSNRPGGRGGDDIYSHYLPPLLYTLQGVVRDELTLQLLSNAVIELAGSDNTVLTVKTDRAGSYAFNNQQILPNTTYKISAKKENYFPKDATITTVGLNVSKDFVENFLLIPFPKDPIPLPEIRYDLARWELLPQYQDSLNGLIEIMKKNPTIVIELISHTDFRDDIIRNDTLSFKRARSVVEYLVTRGIDGERMVPKGRGERDPRKLPNGYTYSFGEYNGISFPPGVTLTEDYINALKINKEKEAAHQLNRRTEFRIIRDDYVPKATNDSVRREVPVIAMNPDDNVVNLTEATETQVVGPCVVIGKSMKFSFKEDLDMMEISADEVLQFFNVHKLTVDNFKDKEKAINEEDGSIVENSIVIIPEMSIGTKVKKNVAARVRSGLDVPIIIGDRTLATFGEYEIDLKAKELVFEK